MSTYLSVFSTLLPPSISPIVTLDLQVIITSSCNPRSSTPFVFNNTAPIHSSNSYTPSHYFSLSVPPYPTDTNPVKSRRQNRNPVGCCCMATMANARASATINRQVPSVLMDASRRWNSGILTLTGGKPGMPYVVASKQNGVKGSKRGNDPAGCCCPAPMDHGRASVSTADNGVASVATASCTVWIGGGALSPSRLLLGLVTTFCSLNLASSACCSGGCRLFCQSSPVLDLSHCLAPTFNRDMRSYLADLAAHNSSVLHGG